MSKRVRIDSLSDALKILDQAIQTRPNEVSDLLATEFESVKDVITEMFPEAEKVFNQAKNTAKEAAENLAEELKETGSENLEGLQTYLRDEIKNRPLTALGIAAVGGLLLGVLLGRRS